MRVRRPVLDVETISAWLAGLSVPVTIVSGLGMAPLMVFWAVALLVLDQFARTRSSVFVFSRLTSVILAVFAVWAAVTIVWSPGDRGFAMVSWLRFAGCCVVGLIVLRRLAAFDDHGRRQVTTALWWGELSSLLVIGLFGIGWRISVLNHSDVGETFRALALHVDRAATVASLFLWPTALGLWKSGHRRRVIALFTLAVICLIPCMSLSAKAALFVGGLALVPCIVCPKWSARAAIVLCVAAIAIAPVAARHLPSPEAVMNWHMPSSLAHRLAIWNFVADKVVEKPLFGHGWQAARSLGEGQSFELVIPGLGSTRQPLLPLHPHDAPLQIWLELGSIGAILMALLCWRMLHALKPTQGEGSKDWPFAAAAFASAFLVASVSYGLWQEWWLETLWLLAALMAMQMAFRQSESQ